MSLNQTAFAYFGAPPLFAEKRFVGRPNIGDRQRLSARFEDILERRWLSNNGYYVQTFERHIEQLLGVKHAIAICNGTIALEILVKALGLTGEVILPSFTFVATAHAVRWLGLTPVFCDVDLNTHTLDPAAVTALITPKTSAIIGVHLWGTPCDIQALQALSEHYQLALIFDAAHALACGFAGRLVGSFGQAEVFSFHATKCVNSFEGGMITTNCDDLAQKLRAMRNLGFVDYDQVICLGTNGKMNEISAAMGLTSLESQGDFIATNRQHFEQYQQILSSIPGLSLYQSTAQPYNYQYIVVEVDATATRLTRDQWVMLLHAENVMARRYFYPGCHRMAPYNSEQSETGQILPHTEWLSERLMVLPTGTGMTSDDLSRMGEWFKRVYDSRAVIAAQIPPTR